MTPTANRGYAIADGIRARSRRPRIAIGGVHATFRPQEALEHADFVVAGEGEGVVGDLVAGRFDPGVIKGQPVQDMNTLPLPARTHPRASAALGGLVRSGALPRAAGDLARLPVQLPVLLGDALFGRRYRYRSAEKVIGDIGQLYARGYRRVFFYDDNFTANRDRVRAILDGVRELGITWNAQARLDFHWKDPARRSQCDRPLLDAMRRSGGDVMFIGYETIEEDVARRWRKGYQGAGSLAERSAEDTRILHDAGFWIHGMFVAGPEQDEGGVDRIVDFARRNRIESLQISALTPFPARPRSSSPGTGCSSRRSPRTGRSTTGCTRSAPTRGWGSSGSRGNSSRRQAFYRNCAFSLGRDAEVLRGTGEPFS